MIDYDAVAGRVASEIAGREAGIMDRIRRRKLQPGDFQDRLIREQRRFIDLTQGAAGRAQEQAVQDVAEAGVSLPRELRKRFPKKT